MAAQVVILISRFLFLAGPPHAYQVLAACLDRGPLMQAKGLAQFTALLLLPIFPKRGES